MPPKKSNLKKPGTAGRGQPRSHGPQPGQQTVDPYNQQNMLPGQIPIMNQPVSLGDMTDDDLLTEELLDSLMDIEGSDLMEVLDHIDIDDIPEDLTDHDRKRKMTLRESVTEEGKAVIKISEDKVENDAQKDRTKSTKSTKSRSKSTKSTKSNKSRKESTKKKPTPPSRKFILGQMANVKEVGNNGGQLWKFGLFSSFCWCFDFFDMQYFVTEMFGESSLTLLHPGSVAAFRTRFRTRFGISGSVLGDCIVTHLCCPCSISQLALEIDDIDRSKK